MPPPSNDAAPPADATPGDAPAVRAHWKFACPACGGEAQWRADRQTLECGYCGTVSPHVLDTSGEIVEHDLVTALRAVPQPDRGWLGERRQVRCQHCHAISVFAPEHQGRACDFCGSAALVPFDEGTDVIRPQSLLPFRVGEPTARDALHRWYGSRFWAPRAFRRRVLTDTLHGVYLPYWTFDADAQARYTAQAGTYHRDKDNRRQVRWRQVSGTVSARFDDTLVCGSRGVHAGLMRAIEPFPTTADLVPYDSGYLSGWTVERYALDLKTAAEQGQQRMLQVLEQQCARDIRADTVRDLRMDARFERRTFKHVLLPVWLVSYRYGARDFQAVVNGHTGQVAGEYPKSWVKIALAVLLALVVLVVLAQLE
jgi:hypothetical protein